MELKKPIYHEKLKGRHTAERLKHIKDVNLNFAFF
jgi:hypothetical protein